MDIGRAALRERLGVWPSGANFPASARCVRDTLDALLDGRCNRRVVSDQPVGNCIEVFERFLGLDDFHLPRNFANTASTLRTLANRPSSTAPPPRPIPPTSSRLSPHSPPLTPPSRST